MSKDYILREAIRALYSNHLLSSSAGQPYPSPSPYRQTFGYLERYAACPIQTPNELMFTLSILHYHRTPVPCLPFTQALPQNTLPVCPMTKEATRRPDERMFTVSVSRHGTRIVLTLQ